VWCPVSGSVPAVRRPDPDDDGRPKARQRLRALVAARLRVAFLAVLLRAGVRFVAAFLRPVAFFLVAFLAVLLRAVVLRAVLLRAVLLRAVV
jgi:hypothetical protein